jgi:hypothetical protein
MVCNPADTNITMKPPGPGPSIPGLGLPFSVPKNPFGDISLPDGIPEDLIDLIDRIFALFPQGIKFQPATDAMTKGIWDALASLFNQLAPFLGLYKFFQALLNIILCIIDVFCALMNPWATLRAVKRLFKRCLPDFLSLFPWLALIIMILALILLLIALIEYIIQIIEAYINQILANLKILSRAIQVKDSDATLAAVQKISFVLCLIEQLFTILMGIGALIAIIQPLMGITGRSVCQGGNSSGGPDDCCTDDFCPPFIRNNPDGLWSISGRLIYQSQIDLSTVGVTVNKLFSTIINDGGLIIRPSRFQFVDDNPGVNKFLDIITPSPEYGFIYWPEGRVYENNSSMIRVPYILDMTIAVNPADFGNPADTHGERLMYISDIIVRQLPTQYAASWNNGVIYQSPISGSLVLVGGKVSEITNDGYSPYFIGGVQATLETLIHKPSKSLMALPAVDDGYSFTDVRYNLRINHEVLIQNNLIGFMCQSDAASEAAVLNAEFNDLRNVFDKMGALPDVDGTITCLMSALARFRADLNEDTSLVFQEDVNACLNSLKTQSIASYARGTAAAADRFSSDFEIYPNLQFIKNDIKVTVRLRDKTGTQLAVGINSEVAAALENMIRAVPTFGRVSDFSYDGYGEFVAALTSDIAGIGEIKAYINNEVVASVINRDNDLPTEIVDRVLSYEFVDRALYRKPGSVDRFDISDIAEDGS